MVEKDVTGLASIHDLKIFDNKLAACMGHIPRYDGDTVVH